MKEFVDMAKEILSYLDPSLAGWGVALGLGLYVFRTHLAKLRDASLDKLGRTIGGAWAYRRFDPEYRGVLRDNHLRLKLVGIRTQEARRPKVVEAFVPLKLAPEAGGGIDAAITLEQLIAGQNYALILGDPGAGKTTLLEYIINEHTIEPPPKSFARRHVEHVLGTLSSIFFPWRRRHYRPIPVYLPLRRCREANETLLDDLLDPETEALPLAIRKRMPKHFLEQALNKGAALILLDGLDELDQRTSYEAVTRKINDFVQLYKNNRVIVTCRKAG